MRPDRHAGRRILEGAESGHGPKRLSEVALGRARSSSWPPVAVGTISLCLASLPGCQEPSASVPLGEEPLETVEISQPADSIFDPDSDQREDRSGMDFAGVLPASFPADLPIYEPSALVDYGADFVVLSVSGSSTAILDRYGDLARKAGWGVAASSGSLSLRKETRTASASVERGVSGEVLLRLVHD